MLAKNATKFIPLNITIPPKIAKRSPSELINLPDFSSFTQKLYRLRRHRHEVEIVTDFDHTLTKHQQNGLKCDSLFGMFGNNKILSPLFQKELFENYKLYGPYETDNTKSFSEKLKYVNRMYQIQTYLFEKHKINCIEAAEVINSSNVVFRSEIRELMECVETFGVPMHIISGGISDPIDSLIRAVVKQDHLSNLSIHSNELQVSKLERLQCGTEKRLLKFNYQKLIHSYNKHFIMSNHPNKKKNCILMGDLKSDIYMAQNSGYDTILSIFYGKAGEFRERMLAENKFDIIVEGDGSHKIAVQLIKMIMGSKDLDWKYLYNSNRIFGGLQMV